jgi:hypothetical protein
MLHERPDGDRPKARDRPQVGTACGRCDMMLTRMAEISLAFRKTAVALHRAVKHEGEWQECNDEQCVRNRYVAEAGGYGPGR